MTDEAAGTWAVPRAVAPMAAKEPRDHTTVP